MTSVRPDRSRRLLLTTAISLVALLWGCLQVSAQTRSSQPPPSGAAAADLANVGRCVWEKLAPSDRAPLIAAAERNDLAAMNSLGNALPPKTTPLAIQCSPYTPAYPSVAGTVVGVALMQEPFAVLIERDLKVSRARLDTAIQGAPARTSNAFRHSARLIIAGRPASAVGPMRSIYGSLGLPKTRQFERSTPATWIVMYMRNYVLIREIVANGGVRSPS
jgi:hypothetical protein